MFSEGGLSAYDTQPCIEVHTSARDRPSVLAWFAEVVIIARYLATKGLLEAFAQQIRLVRGRFGNYEPIDFLDALRAAQLRRWVDIGEHWRFVGPKGTPLHRL